MVTVILFGTFLLIDVAYSSPYRRKPELRNYSSRIGNTKDIFIGVNHNRKTGRAEKVCMIDGAAYRDGDPVPTSNQCEFCVCRPPGFACSLLQCAPPRNKKCRTLQRSGACCPEYQCDCEKDGKIYKSGQKILSRQKPCDVCFCQGGDLLCSKIHCFTRNDCEGINVPGRCCPSYDHCDLPQVGFTRPRPFNFTTKVTHQSFFPTASTAEVSIVTTEETFIQEKGENILDQVSVMTESPNTATQDASVYDEIRVTQAELESNDNLENVELTTKIQLEDLFDEKEYNIMTITEKYDGATPLIVEITATEKLEAEKPTISNNSKFTESVLSTTQSSEFPEGYTFTEHNIEYDIEKEGAIDQNTYFTGVTTNLPDINLITLKTEAYDLSVTTQESDNLGQEGFDTIEASGQDNSTTSFNNVATVIHEEIFGISDLGSGIIEESIKDILMGTGSGDFVVDGIQFANSEKLGTDVASIYNESIDGSGNFISSGEEAEDEVVFLTSTTTEFDYLVESGSGIFNINEASVNIQSESSGQSSTTSIVDELESYVSEKLEVNVTSIIDDSIDASGSPMSGQEEDEDDIILFLSTMSSISESIETTSGISMTRETLGYTESDSSAQSKESVTLNIFEEKLIHTPYDNAPVQDEGSGEIFSLGVVDIGLQEEDRRDDLFDISEEGLLNTVSEFQQSININKEIEAPLDAEDFTTNYPFESLSNDLSEATQSSSQYTGLDDNTGSGASIVHELGSGYGEYYQDLVAITESLLASDGSGEGFNEGSSGDLPFATLTNPGQTSDVDGKETFGDSKNTSAFTEKTPEINTFDSISIDLGKENSVKLGITTTLSDVSYVVELPEALNNNQISFNLEDGFIEQATKINSGEYITPQYTTESEILTEQQRGYTTELNEQTYNPDNEGSDVIEIDLGVIDLFEIFTTENPDNLLTASVEDFSGFEKKEENIIEPLKHKANTISYPTEDEIFTEFTTGSNTETTGQIETFDANQDDESSDGIEIDLGANSNEELLDIFTTQDLDDMLNLGVTEFSGIGGSEGSTEEITEPTKDDTSTAGYATESDVFTKLTTQSNAEPITEIFTELTTDINIETTEQTVTFDSNQNDENSDAIEIDLGANSNEELLDIFTTQDLDDMLNFGVTEFSGIGGSEGSTEEITEPTKDDTSTAGYATESGVFTKLTTQSNAEPITEIFTELTTDINIETTEQTVTFDSNQNDENSDAIEIDLGATSNEELLDVFTTKNLDDMLTLGVTEFSGTGGSEGSTEKIIEPLKDETSTAGYVTKSDVFTQLTAHGNLNATKQTDIFITNRIVYLQFKNGDVIGAASNEELFDIFTTKKLDDLLTVSLIGFSGVLDSEGIREEITDPRKNETSHAGYATDNDLLTELTTHSNTEPIGPTDTSNSQNSENGDVIEIDLGAASNEELLDVSTTKNWDDLLIVSVTEFSDIGGSEDIKENITESPEDETNTAGYTTETETLTHLTTNNITGPSGQKERLSTSQNHVNSDVIEIDWGAMSREDLTVTGTTEGLTDLKETEGLEQIPMITMENSLDTNDFSVTRTNSLNNEKNYLKFSANNDTHSVDITQSGTISKTKVTENEIPKKTLISSLSDPLNMLKELDVLLNSVNDFPKAFDQSDLEGR